MDSFRESRFYLRGIKSEENSKEANTQHDNVLHITLTRISRQSFHFCNDLNCVLLDR